MVQEFFSQYRQECSPKILSRLTQQQYNFETYAYSYWEAFKLLANHIINTQYDSDITIYPLAYIGFNAIELRLKTMIIDIDKDKFMKKHSVCILFEHIKKDINRYIDQDIIELKQKFVRAEQILKEIEFICDDHNTRFRYPHEKNIDKLIDINVDVGGLISAFSELYEILDELNNIICIENENRNNLSQS